MNKQIRRLGLVLLALYGALFVQLNVVQVLRAEEYSNHPANRRKILRDFGEPRGVIQTADGVVLARSVESDGPFGQRREYPEGELFGHITGYYSFAYGADGAEKSYNDDLVGRTIPVSVGSLGDLLLEDDHTADVTLTLTKAVQEAAAFALGGRPGSVVALDPRDGAILALYSAPSFDPNLLVVENQQEAAANRQAMLDDPGKPLRAKSYEERYFPGSTFKVVTAGAGLTSGKVTPTTPDYPRESEWVPPQTTRPIKNFGGSTCGGTLFEILRVSCNTAFARMGVDVGADQMSARAEAFGFNQEPPLDLPSAVASRFPPPEFFEENIPLLAQSAIGQNEVQASPLQMALVAAAIGNGGVAPVPHVMAEIRDDEGNVIDTGGGGTWTTAVSPDVAATLRDAMVGVVENGTAKRLAIPGIQVAGKTGTAQLGTDPPRSHAWIIGFAPADNPRVAVAVIVEGQPGASEQTGGTVAAPIAKAVLEAALAQSADSAQPDGGE